MYNTAKTKLQLNPKRTQPVKFNEKSRLSICYLDGFAWYLQPKS